MEQENRRKRGVAVNDSGVPEVKPGSAADGLQFQTPTQKNEKVASAAKNSPSWDEDWTLPTKSSASRDPEPANFQVNKSTVPSQPSNRTTVPTTCAAVDIEWPPRQSTNVSAQPANDETRLSAAGTSSTLSFDELDSFANWPPRPNGASIAARGFHNSSTTTRPLLYNSGSSLNNNLIDSRQFQTANNDFWTFNNASLSTMKLQQESSGINASNPDPMNSFGVQNHSQGMPSFGSSSYSSNQKPPVNISSIFSSSKTEQGAMKLAPPPSIAVGRVRGRGRSEISTSKPSGLKQQQTKQPSLLDLL